MLSSGKVSRSQVGCRVLSQGGGAAASWGARSKCTCLHVHLSVWRAWRLGEVWEGWSSLGSSHHVSLELLRQINKLVGDLSVCNELLDNPLKALATLDHVNDQHSLVVSVLFQDMLFELDIATSDTDHKWIVVCVLLDVQSLTANQVKIVLDHNNWESNIEFLDVESDLLVDLVALYCPKLHWNVGEKIIALLIEFRLRDSKLTKFTEYWLLISSEIDCIFKQWHSWSFWLNCQNVHCLLFLVWFINHLNFGTSHTTKLQFASHLLSNFLIHELSNFFSLNLELVLCKSLLSQSFSLFFLNNLQSLK